MLKQTLSLHLAFLFFASLPAVAQVQRYEQKDVRRHLLETSANLKPQKIELRGELPREPNKRDFILKFIEDIQPELEKMGMLDTRASILHLLLDSGSENSPEEKAEWQKQYTELASQSNEYLVNDKWIEKVLAWGKMAENLDGELARFARHYATATEFSRFAPEMKPMLDQIEEKQLAYQNAINQTQAAKGITESRKGMADAVRLYKSGAITFEEAQAKINDLARRVGTRFVGAEAAKSHGHLLNEIAILRSQLAKSKGYPTWAEYQLQASGQGYSPEYRGAANQRKFLRAWLEESQPLERAYYKRRVKELGLEKIEDTLRLQHLSLLSLPDLSLAQPYFPPDQITNIWEKTMIESGFDKDMMKDIIVDDLPREGKNPVNAYMSPTITPSAAVRELNMKTLDFSDVTAQRPSLIYVLQSFRGAGLDEMRTAMHELMGHAFEYLTKGKELYSPEGYGYVETPSMTSEYFLDDPEFLHANAIPVDGKKPSVEQFREWITNARVGDALGLTFRASSALYDIDIWDYDYSAKDALTYMQRVELVSKDIDQRTDIYPDVENDVPMHYFWVATVHFVSGQVRNIGYSYATLSSQMMASHLSERLKETTGRASWFNQPGLASIVINDFYKQGWKSTFPENIEKITGRKFDPKAVIGELAQPLKSCEQILK